MKGIIEEYGKIIITSLITIALLSVLVFFIRGDITERFTPKSTVGQENASDKLRAYGSILNPVLLIETSKLESGTAYDLLSFVKEAHSNPQSRDAEGQLIYQDEATQSLELLDNVRVTEIKDPLGQDIEVPVKTDGKMMITFDSYELDQNKETPDDYTTGYQVTYEVSDDYYEDYPVTTSKICQFIVD